MNYRPAIALMAITVTLLGVGAQAATLAVPGQYLTVRAALADAASGDVVEIDPGTYLEYDLVMPAGVTLAGTGTIPQDVIISGGQQGRILLLESLPGTVTLRNIAFLNGHAKGLSSYDQSGGALFISNSNARIENCVFSANTADSHGGAIRCSNSSPEIVSCQFYANSAPDGGGGALDISYNSSPLVIDCHFLSNRADWGAGLSCRGGSSPRVENCKLEGNDADGLYGFGGGIFADNLSYPDLLRTTISNNQARFGGGLVSYTDGPINLDYCTVVENRAWILEGGMLIVNSSPLITGSIVAFNQGHGIAVSGEMLPQITCTDMYGNSWGDWAVKLQDMMSQDGNLSVDPQFCYSDPDADDQYGLQSNSPLVREGPGCGTLGSQSVICSLDKSADELPTASAAISMVQAAPNPFNPQTVISFELAKAQDVRVSVYGLDGRLVNVLGEGMKDVGAHEMMWNGADRSGRKVSSGVYFVMVQGREDTQRLKVTLLK